MLTVLRKTFMSRRVVYLCSLALFQKGCWASRGIRPSPEPCPPAPPARSMCTLNQNNARHGTQQAQQQHTQYTFSPGFPTASCPLHAHSLGSTVLHMPDDASSHDMATHSSTSTPPSCYVTHVMLLVSLLLSHRVHASLGLTAPLPQGPLPCAAWTPNSGRPV